MHSCPAAILHFENKKPVLVNVYITENISEEEHLVVNPCNLVVVVGDPRYERWMRYGIVEGGKHDGKSIYRIEYRDSCEDWILPFGGNND